MVASPSIIIQDGIKHEYKLDDLGDTKPNIVIGGADISVENKFVPNLNASFQCFSGSEKYFVNFNRKGIAGGTTEVLQNGELSFITGDETDKWSVSNDGRSKWDVIYAKKPPSNIVEWELKCSPELDFLYQDPSDTNTWPFLDANPEYDDDIVGSYAIYCERGGHLKSADGKDDIYNYFAGKLSHLYRPLCIDDDGKEEWADLELIKISDILYTLRAIIPQVFLDSAKYPLTLDPNLGYDTKGGTYTNGSNANYMGCYNVTAGSNGTATTIVTWNKATELDKLKVSLYATCADGADRVLNSYEELSPSGDTEEFDVSGESYAISNGSDYHPALGCEAAGHGIYYDIGVSGDARTESIAYASQIADPGNFSNDNVGRYSVYLVYTAAGGAAPTGHIEGPLVGPLGGPI
jgi:hypothetical protein